VKVRAIAVAVAVGDGLTSVIYSRVKRVSMIIKGEPVV
jgi:hypothetical protein